MLKLGIFGVGHLGKIHIKCIRQVNSVELVGFCDPNEAAAQYAINEFGLKRYNSPQELIAAVDAVDIVAPTFAHYDLAKESLLHNKHLFIEKPLTETPAQAAELTSLAADRNIVVQVGHVERFNPAFLALESVPLNPMFIEAHRLSVFNPRGTDVSVVLDLMIHDLDILLNIVKSNVKSVHANGVTIVSAKPDICNARIEFENGAVANLTASRMSMKQMRKIRLFQEDAYISMDFLAKKSQVIRLHNDKKGAADPNALMELDTYKGKRYIEIQVPEYPEVNAIKMEIETFAQSILEGKPIRVGLEDGMKALDLAHRINNSIVQ